MNDSTTNAHKTTGGDTDGAEISGRCTAITQTGHRCKNDAAQGTEYCYIHQPADASRDDNGVGEQIPVEEELKDRQRRERLIAELDELIGRVQAMYPDYRPPGLPPRQMVELINEKAGQLPAGLRRGILERLRYSFNEDLFDAETWKGMWYMVNYTLNYQADIVRRRFKGDYETDDWGLDWEYLEVIRPFLDFMHKAYFRVETTGIDGIPDYERTLLVSNHSGQLPWDGVMIMTAVLNEHPAQRLVRNLYPDWFPTLPFLSSALVKMGQALASVENGARLLEQDELVGVFPEGYKGIGKPYKDRYRLARFGRGDFVKMALNTQATIIPVSVVGAEETYISIVNSPTLARIAGSPYFPISLRFPWLGPLGLIPFPTKWYIDFGEPMTMDGHDLNASEDPVLVSQIADRVRNTLQEMIQARLAERRSVFY